MCVCVPALLVWVLAEARRGHQILNLESLEEQQELNC